MRIIRSDFLRTSKPSAVPSAAVEDALSVPAVGQCSTQFIIDWWIRQRFIYTRSHVVFLMIPMQMMNRELIPGR